MPGAHPHVVGQPQFGGLLGHHVHRDVLGVQDGTLFQPSRHHQRSLGGQTIGVGDRVDHDLAVIADLHLDLPVAGHRGAGVRGRQVEFLAGAVWILIVDQHIDTHRVLIDDLFQAHRVVARDRGEQRSVLAHQDGQHTAGGAAAAIGDVVVVPQRGGLVRGRQFHPVVLHRHLGDGGRVDRLHRTVDQRHLVAVGVDVVGGDRHRQQPARSGVDGVGSGEGGLIHGGQRADPHPHHRSAHRTEPVRDLIPEGFGAAGLGARGVFQVALADGDRTQQRGGAVQASQGHRIAIRIRTCGGHRDPHRRPGERAPIQWLRVGRVVLCICGDDGDHRGRRGEPPIGVAHRVDDPGGARVGPGPEAQLVPRHERDRTRVVSGDAHCRVHRQCQMSRRDVVEHHIDGGDVAGPHGGDVVDCGWWLIGGFGRQPDHQYRTLGGAVAI